VAVLIDIARLVAGMIVVFARDFLLTSLVAMAVLVEITRLVAGMIVMWPGFFLRHYFLHGSRARTSKQRKATRDFVLCSLSQ